MCGQYVILGEPCHCTPDATPFDDEDETEETRNASQSITHSLDCLGVTSISREKCESIRTAEQLSNQVEDSAAGIPEYSETNADTSPNVPKEFSHDYFPDEFIKDDLNNRGDVVETLQIVSDRTKSKHDVVKKTLRKSDVDRHGLNHERALNEPKEAMVKKLVTENSKGIEEKLEYTTEQEVVPGRNEETDARQQYAVEEKGRIEVEEFVQKPGMEKDREEEERKSSIVIQNEGQQYLDEAYIEEIVDRRRDVVTKKNLRKRSANDETIETVDRSVEKFKGYDQSRSKKYAEASEASVQLREELQKETKEAKKFYQNDGSRSRKIDEDDMQTSKLISDSRKAIASGGITSKVSQSNIINEAIATERSSVLLQDDLPILESLHRSLAVLSPRNQKPTDEKEIIEIYRKFSIKEKSKAAECTVRFLVDFFSYVQSSMFIEVCPVI